MNTTKPTLSLFLGTALAGCWLGCGEEPASDEGDEIRQASQSLQEMGRRDDDVRPHPSKDFCPVCEGRYLQNGTYLGRFSIPRGLPSQSMSFQLKRASFSHGVLDATTVTSVRTLSGDLLEFHLRGLIPIPITPGSHTLRILPASGVSASLAELDLPPQPSAPTF